VKAGSHATSPAGAADTPVGTAHAAAAFAPASAGIASAGTASAGTAPGESVSPAAETSPPAAASTRRWHALGDRVLRIVGGVVAVWASIVLAILGVFLTPLYAGGFRLPISLLLAVVGNAGLIWFTWRATGQRLFALVPGVIWLLVVGLFGVGRREGDLGLVQQNWVAMLYLLAGALTVGVAGFRLILPAAPGTVPAPRRR
jgi:hypothetical protein